MDLEMFRCDRQAATLSTRACARMFESTLAAAPNPWQSSFKCVGCPLGAKHAGRDQGAVVAQVVAQGLEGFCPRCQRGGLRIIKTRGICVSCYNRAREMERGRNARGSRPRKLPGRLGQAEIIVHQAVGAPEVVRVSGVTSSTEAILRLVKEGRPIRISLAAGPDYPRGAQLPLFDAPCRYRAAQGRAARRAPALAAEQPRLLA